MQESAQDGVAEPTPAGGTSAPALGPPRPPSRSRVAPAAGLEAERGSGGDGSSPGEPDGRTPPGPSDVVIGPPLGAMWDRKGSTVARQTMLSPTSRYRLGWDGMMVALVLGLCVYFPFQLAFADIHPDAFRWTPALDIALTAFFAVDIALNFRTGYVEDKTGAVVMEPRLVARRYARTWLALDVVATVPWDVVARAVDAGEPASAALFPRLLRAVRLYRLAKLIRLFRLLRAFKLREMFKDTLEDLNIDRNYLSLLKLLGTVALLAHVLACGYFGVAASAESYPAGTWVEEQGLAQGNLGQHYLTALYFIAALQTTIGFGDVVPRTRGERLYSLFAMLLAAGLYGYSVAKLSHLVAQMNVGRRTLNQKMNELATYMELRQFPRDLRLQIRQYYKYFLARRTVHNEQEVVGMLSTQLQQEVSRFYMGVAVKDVPFFEGRDPRFVRALVPSLKPVFFGPSQGVIKEGAYGREMYFIQSGTARVVLDRGLEHEVAVAVLEKGQLFGEMAILMEEQNSRRCATVRAVTSCDMLTVNGDTLRKVLAEHPAVLEDLLEGAMSRAEQTRALWAAHVAWKRAKRAVKTHPRGIARSRVHSAINFTKRLTMTAWTRHLERQLRQRAQLRVQNMVSAATIDEVFQEFDTDGSGTIELPEFRSMLPVLSLYLPEEYADKVFHIVAGENGTRIGINEFRACMLVLQRLQSLEGDDFGERLDFNQFKAQFSTQLGKSARKERELRRQAFLQLARPMEDEGEGGGHALEADAMRSQLQRLRSAYNAACAELQGQREARAALEHRLQQLESGAAGAVGVEGGRDTPSRVAPHSIAASCSLLRGADQSTAESPAERGSISRVAPSGVVGSHSRGLSGDGVRRSDDGDTLPFQAPVAAEEGAGEGPWDAGASVPDGADSRSLPATMDSAEDEGAASVPSPSAGHSSGGDATTQVQVPPSSASHAAGDERRQGM